MLELDAGKAAVRGAAIEMTAPLLKSAGVRTMNKYGASICQIGCLHNKTGRYS
jgi:hypothetical protein